MARKPDETSSATSTASDDSAMIRELALLLDERPANIGKVT